MSTRSRASSSRSAPTSACSTSSSRRSRRSTPSASSTSPPASTWRSSSSNGGSMAIDGLIGRKLGMTQGYSAQGVLVPVTVILAGPGPVVATRRGERDGYAAAQMGFGAARAQRLPKPLAGQFTKAGTGAFAVLREFRLADGEAPAVGSQIRVGDGGRHDAPPVQRLPRVARHARILPPRRLDREPLLSGARLQGQADGRPL